MKLVFTLLAAVILFAQNFSEIYDLYKQRKYDKVVSILSSKNNLTQNEEFLLALSYYRMHKYQQAYTLFNRLFKKEMGNVKYNFYLGKCAEKLGRYKLAIGAFERILIYEPKNVAAKLELAKIYIQTKEYIVAREYLNELKKDVRNPVLKKEVNKLLRYVELKIQKHFFKLFAMLGVNYDSNIYNRPLSDSFDVYINGDEYTVDNTTDKKRVYGLVKGAVFKHLYIGDGFVYSDNFLIYSNTYPKASDNNILLVKYSPECRFKRFEYIPYFSYLKYASEPLFNQAGMKINYKTSKNSLVGVNFAYTNYLLQKNDNKDSKSVELYAQYRKNGNDIKAGIKLQRKIKGNDPNVDYNSYKVSYNYEYKIDGFKVKPGGSFEFKDYLFTDYLFGKERLEKKYILSLNVDKPIKSSLFQFNVKRVYNFSNIEVYEYKKWLAGVNLIIPLVK